MDALYGCLSLDRREGLAHFLHAHTVALDAIEQAIRANKPSMDCPLHLSAIARRDLARLGAPCPSPGIFPELADAHPWGLIYVIAGAHLGARVLKERWKRSTDTAVRQAGEYLSASEMKTYWPIFVKQLNALEPTPAETSSILSGADAAFAVFEQAFRIAEAAMHEGR